MAVDQTAVIAAAFAAARTTLNTQMDALPATGITPLMVREAIASGIAAGVSAGLVLALQTMQLVLGPPGVPSALVITSPIPGTPVVGVTTPGAFE